MISGVNRLGGVMGLYTLSGHVTSGIIVNWFKHVLLPECQEGDHVYLDRASYWGGGNAEQVRCVMRVLFAEAKVHCHYLPARSPLFNPDEFFNGWLKQRVKERVAVGLGNPLDPRQCIHDTVEEARPRLPQMCAGWVGRVYPSQ